MSIQHSDEHYQPPSVTSVSDTEDICDEIGKVLQLYDQLMDLIHFTKNWRMRRMSLYRIALHVCGSST